MKLKLNFIIAVGMLCVNFITYAQTTTTVGFDIRGRDCNGGLGLCSVNKMSSPNNNISVKKTGKYTFVLTINRASLTREEQTSIAGQPFSELQTHSTNTFRQSGDLMFNSEVVQALGFPSKYRVLKKGSYPMQIKEDVVIITLSVSEGE